jgi:hypothetical protein
MDGEGLHLSTSLARTSLETPVLLGNHYCHRVGAFWLQRQVQASQRPFWKRETSFEQQWLLTSRSIAHGALLYVCLFSGSNVTSVAEDEIMRILILMRNFIPGYKQVRDSSSLQ